LVYQQLKDESGLSFPDFDNLSSQWDTGAEYIALYPNVLFGVHRDHAYAIILEPKSLEHTSEHISLYYTESGANDQRYEKLRKKNARLWDDIFKEDIFVVEGMQAWMGPPTLSITGSPTSSIPIALKIRPIRSPIRPLEKRVCPALRFEALLVAP